MRANINDVIAKLTPESIVRNLNRTYSSIGIIISGTEAIIFATYRSNKNLLVRIVSINIITLM